MNNLITKKIIIMAAATTVLACLIVLFVHFSESPSHHNFQTPQATVLTASTAGTMKFVKPPEFVTNDPPSSPWRTYRAISQSNGHKVTYGYLVVATAPVDSSALTILDSFNQKLKEPVNSSAYKEAANPITSFVKTTLNNNYPNISVVNASPLYNTNIKSNAWQFDVAVSNGKDGAPDLQGKAVYAWTDEAAYFYILAVAKNDWQPNLNTWQSMLNSISLQ